MITLFQLNIMIITESVNNYLRYVILMTFCNLYERIEVLHRNGICCLQ